MYDYQEAIQRCENVAVVFSTTRGLIIRRDFLSDKTELQLQFGYQWSKKYLIRQVKQLNRFDIIFENDDLEKAIEAYENALENPETITYLRVI